MTVRGSGALEREVRGEPLCQTSTPTKGQQKVPRTLCHVSAKAQRELRDREAPSFGSHLTSKKWDAEHLKIDLPRVRQSQRGADLHEWELQVPSLSASISSAFRSLVCPTIPR